MNLITKIASSFLFLAVIGCGVSQTDIELRRANELFIAGQYSKSLYHFEKVVKRAPRSPLGLKASRKASEISLLYTAQYEKALKYLKHIILYSKSSRERITAQEKLADIYFSKVNNFESAIFEYQQLLRVEKVDSKRTNYRFNIAQSYFKMNKTSQTLKELESLLKKELRGKTKFDILLFKGNVLQTSKQIDKAIEVYQSLREEFPELSKKENIGLNIAVAFEDQGKYDISIRTLQEIRSDYPVPDLIDVKIRRLRQRNEQFAAQCA